MKLRIEIADDLPEDEVYIRCRAVTDEISHLQRVIQGAAHKVELQLYIGDTEYYVSPEKILFFETADGKVSAHTRDRMYLPTQSCTNWRHCFPTPLCGFQSPAF